MFQNISELCICFIHVGVCAVLDCVCWVEILQITFSFEMFILGIL